MACYPGQPALQQSLAEHGAPGGMDVHDATRTLYIASFPDPVPIPHSQLFDNFKMFISLERLDNDPCDFELDDSGPLKPHSTQSTIKWLEGNYHYEEGICLPRSTIYEHYLDFCQREQLQPVNAASFGKIIRQQFPTLTTRRLGTRGQSKYHYYGLGIKSTSRYYTQEYVQKQQNPGITRKEPEAKKPHVYYSSKEKPSAVLPPFPDVSSLELSDSVLKEKLHTFMIMYRAHCQRVLDSIVKATFDDVENFLLHFWQGMPNHLLPVLGSDTVIDLVAICDSTLYKAVSNVFISSPLQLIPENVAQEVHRFSTNLKPWLDTALKGLPDSLRTVKSSVADVFSQNLQRQRSLMHLADAARNALRGEEVLIQMSEDWAALDIEAIIAQTLCTIQPLDVPQQYLDMVPQFLDGFAHLLSEEKSSVEDFAVWVDDIINKCFKKCQTSKSVKEIGKVFLLTWKFFTSKVIREFTLTSAPSFGTFHLLHMLIDDYISHCLETLMEDEAQKAHFTNINLPTPESSAVGVQDEEKVSTLEAAEPTAISEMALPSEPAPDFPLVAQAPASFSLPHTDNLTSTHHNRSQSDGSELNLHPPPSQDFPSSLDHSIAEGTGVGIRESVLPEGGSLSAHLSTPAGLNTNQSTARNLGSIGLPGPPPIGGGLSVSTHSSSTNPLTSNNPLSSFIPNPSSLSSLTSIGGGGGGGGSVLPSGLRLQDGTSSMTQHSHPPQLPPLPSHLSSLSFMNPFAVSSQLQSSSLGMGGGSQHGQQQQQQHSRTQTQSHIVGQTLPAITSAPSSQHLQQQPQHNIQAPGNLAALNLQTLTTSSNLPSGGMPPMPLSHNMAGGTGGLPGSLSNPSALPLLPGMHNMYPYPYTGALPSAAAAVQSLPSQPITSAMVRMNTPAFPSQTLVPGYPSYVAPSLYGNTQPPVTNGSFTR